MHVATASVSSSRDRLLLCFAVLQLLDLLTTLAVFSRGGSELNPIISSLFPFTGPVAAVFISKIVLVWLAFRFSQRNWILYVGVGLYAAIVTWNSAMLLIAR